MSKIKYIVEESQFYLIDTSDAILLVVQINAKQMIK